MAGTLHKQEGVAGAMWDQASGQFEGSCTFKDFEHSISLVRRTLYKGHSGQRVGDGRKTCQEVEIGTGPERWKELKTMTIGKEGKENISIKRGRIYGVSKLTSCLEGEMEGTILCRLGGALGGEMGKKQDSV